MIQIEVFKRLREDKNLTQAALAAAAGVSQQLIGEIETGRTRSTKSIYKIAAALGTAAHILDQDIPSLEGRAVKLIDDLKTIDSALAEVVLQNAERTIESYRQVKQNEEGIQKPSGDKQSLDMLPT